MGTLAPGTSVTLGGAPSGGTTIAIGTSTTVTTSNGYLLYAGGSPVFLSQPLTGTATSLYAIAAAASQTLQVAWQTRS